jgi:GNAT superfamily N-acetyltransferase
MIIRPILTGEEEAICKLVMRSFNAYVGYEYSPEGVAEFLKYVNPAAMAMRLSSEHFILVAEYEQQPVGMIEFRKCEHISLLFVDPVFFRKGISRRLFDEAMLIVKKENPTLEKLTVNSSRYAVPAYESFGFITSGPEQTINGITFVPMHLVLNTSDRKRLAGEE